MTGPLVSVCVISYNHSKYVIQTLESITAQTYENIELIIQDDHSTDGSFELIRAWCEKNAPDASIERNESNVGTAANLNKAVARCSGEYISFVGSDDRYVNDKIEKQVQLLSALADDVGMIYSDAFIIDSESQRYFSRFIQMNRHFMKVPEGNIFNELLIGNFIPAMSVLIRKHVLEEVGPFDENLGYEDYDYWIRVSRKYNIIFSDHPSVEYRIHDLNYHKSHTGWDRDNFKIYAKHIDAGPEVEFKMREICESLYYKKEYAVVIDLLRQYGKGIRGSNVIRIAAILRIPIIAYKAYKRIFK